MNNKIQELTDIIFNEGVAKGQAQADSIVAQAQTQAETILADARKEAAEIVQAARKESAAHSENVHKELKLYAQQVLEALKSQIATTVTDRIAGDAVKGLFADSESFNSLVLEIARQWDGAQAPVISTAQADKMKAWFTAKAKDLLDGGLEIRQVAGRDAFFSIQPKDGSYRVDFGDAEFENWLKSMLRDQIVELLF